MEGLRVRSFRVRRGSFLVEVDDLLVPPGAVGGLKGRSGSGKSTVLEALAGFLPSQGEVWVGGKRVDALKAEKRCIALVFQKPALFPHLNLEDNIAFGLRVKGVGKLERRKGAEKWLERVGLSGYSKRMPGEVSAGQAQRVALARALIVQFPVVLLDEPFSALDGEIKRSLYTLFLELVAETKVSALLVSHDPSELELLCSKVWLQENGRVSSL
jgi:ABC-type Fe3+/spermidine/putrescine transport system ATPase subunit